MKKSMVFAFVVTAALLGRAQVSFEKYYTSNLGVSATMSMCELTSGNLLTGIGLTSLLSQQGDVLNVHSYEVIPMTKMLSHRKLTDNSFYFCGGYLADSCGANGSSTIPFTYPVIGKMDSMGTIQSMHRYVLNGPKCTYPPMDLEVTQGGGAVVWDSDDRFFALRVDSSGAPVWSRQFDHEGSITFIRELPGGDLLAGITMDTAGIVVARLTANGDPVWSRSYIRTKGRILDCVVESDGSFIITGYTDRFTGSSLFPLPSEYDPKLFLMKLDGSGQVQWCKGYATPSGWYADLGAQVERTAEGDYVVLANTGVPNYNWEDKLFLMKADANGDTLWTRSIGVGGYRYLAASLLAASDGGYYVDGLATGNFGQWSDAMFLFKTDVLGQLPCHAGSLPVEVVDLFPADSSVTLNSFTGATQQPASVSDMQYDPMVAIDACTIGGLVETGRPERQIRVRPNPNTGRFTLDFKDALLADTYYSVFDATGKLLYQRPLPAGKGTEEVDLSRYSKGIYVIKCTAKDGVYHQRVVVE